MVMLYTCVPCSEGKHEKCERGYGDGKSFGGGHCVCLCHGRSEKKWKADEERAWKKYRKLIFDTFRKKKSKPIQLD